MSAGRLLNHSLVVGPGAHPASLLLLLHGFFGAGRNWGTVARALAAARRDWGVVLADLRLHGASQGFPPPHTLEACAGDLAALRAALDVPVRAVLGHSFGGKVALTHLAHRPPGLRQIWIVDADPSAGPPRGGAWEMLRAVRALPPVFRRRDELVAALERAGFDRRTAEWMATNLDPQEAAATAGRPEVPRQMGAEDGYRWRLDFAALEALLLDFFRADLWPVVLDPPPGVDLRVVKATRSQVIPDVSLARLEAVARAGGRVAVDTVPGGHWLNADNPEAVTALLAARLPRA